MLCSGVVEVDWLADWEVGYRVYCESQAMFSGRAAMEDDSVGWQGRIQDVDRLSA